MSDVSTDLIAANLAGVQSVIAAACARAGRRADDVALVAVSKRKSVAHILAASQAGVVHFGENRVEEMQDKRQLVMDSATRQIKWHMIGHIQSRKARHVRNLFDTVESIDSLKIAHKLSESIIESKQPPLTVLAQVNVSGEATKGGFEASGWESDRDLFTALAGTLRKICDLPGLTLTGLMTMAPFYDEPEQTRPVFASLRILRDALLHETGIALPELSMGMTNDYPVAIEEGATMVRIGRAIFGERAY